MATTYTDGQKRDFVKQAQKEGREAAGQAAGVSTTTISHWAKAIGVKFTAGKSAAPRRSKRSKRAATNGKARTRRAAPRARGVEAPSGSGLDVIRDQLLSALKTLEAMRTAHRQVFG